MGPGRGLVSAGLLHTHMVATQLKQEYLAGHASQPGASWHGSQPQS